MSFIGRGEKKAKQILYLLFGWENVFPQMPITKIKGYEKFGFNEEVLKHKFDIYISTSTSKILFEVNHKHGEKAAKKYRQVFEPFAAELGMKFVNLNDWDSKSIFKDDDIVRWSDFEDVINALKLAGVEP